MAAVDSTASRDYARKHAEQAVALLAHAFNAADNPDTPYRYSNAVRKEFENVASRSSN